MPFVPSPIKVTLKMGKKVISKKFFKGMFLSIEIDDIDLKAGDYEIIIEPKFNTEAEQEPEHKILCIDILCS